jgi:DNA (cytosine-5)-methyltransferase 1
MIKIASQFSGIGSFEQAITNLGIEHENIMAVDFDKYARQTYTANFGEPKHYFVDSYNADYENVENVDVFLSSPPCQSFSLAGKRLGESDPRGLLFFETLRFINCNKPKYFIIENVKGLLSMDDGEVFRNWIQLLGQSENGNTFMFPHEDSLMYNLHWQVLNTKDYGLPQNRERVFLVGIRNDLPNDFNFPKTIPLKLRLKDILEDIVDEKYYLSEKMINYLTTRKDNFNNGKINFKGENDIASCINASSKSLDISYNIIHVGNVNPSGNGMNGNVFSDEGLCPTLTTNKGEGVKVMIGAMRGRYNESGKTNQELEIKDDNITNTLTSVQKDNLVIEKPYLEFQIADYRADEGLRIRKDNISPCMTSSMRDSPEWNPKAGTRNPPITSNGFKIRKLTPKECFRLQGFLDEFLQNAIDAGVSNSQLYKQAGNSISVPVIQAILKNLLK